MQIRLSWQLLGAILIFLIALVIIGRSMVGRGQGGSAPSAEFATPEVAIATATAAVPATAPIPTNTIAVTLTPEPSPTAAITATPPAQPTASASPTSTTPPSPLPPTATPTPEAVGVVVQGFAQSGAEIVYGFVVVNPNPDLIARDLRYQTAVFDQDGRVLGTDTGTIEVIGPAQQTAAVGAVTLPEEGLQVARAEIILGGAEFVQAVPMPPFGVENLALIPGDPDRVTAIVRNPYSQNIEDLRVVALVFDENDQVAGGGAATIAFLLAGGQAAAEVPVVYSGTAQSIGLYPRPATLLSP